MSGVEFDRIELARVKMQEIPRVGALGVDFAHPLFDSPNRAADTDSQWGRLFATGSEPEPCSRVLGGQGKVDVRKLLRRGFAELHAPILKAFESEINPLRVGDVQWQRRIQVGEESRRIKLSGFEVPEAAFRKRVRAVLGRFWTWLRVSTQTIEMTLLFKSARSMGKVAFRGDLLRRKPIKLLPP